MVPRDPLEERLEASRRAFREPEVADPAARLTILAECEGERLHVCFANRARRELARVESNHIGLRTCEAILQLLGGQFFTHRTGDDFSAEFVLPRTPPDAAQG